MASSIDITKPITGNPTTQSVRDNFSAAKTEIEALQAREDVPSGTTDRAMLAWSAGGAAYVEVTSATLDSSGNLSAVGGTFSGAVSGTTGTFTGAVSAVGGLSTDGGEIVADEAVMVFYDTDTTQDYKAKISLSSDKFKLHGTNWAGSTFFTFFDGDMITGDIEFYQDVTFLTISDLGTVTTADINGGSIDGTTVGASSASTGAFTTLSASGAASFTSTLNVSSAANLHVEGSDLMDGFKRFVSCSQATYDALTPDANTVYFIT